jgi:hypothetical protein
METLLVQILGGIFGFTIAYIIYRLFELPYERSTAEARVKYLAEMAELRKAQESARKRAKSS